MDINLNNKFNEILSEIDKNNKPNLFLHVCCGPCSTSVLKRIIDYFNLPDINSDIYYMKKKVLEEMNNELFFQPSLRKIEALRRRQKREEKERKRKQKEEEERRKQEEKE